jgi:hypothetical protein
MKKLIILLSLFPASPAFGQAPTDRIDARVQSTFDLIVNTQTFSVIGATPSVAGGIVFKTNNVGPMTVTNFVGGSDSQKIVILCGDANTTIQDNVNIVTSSGADIVCTTGKLSEFVYDAGAGKWHQNGGTAAGPASSKVIGTNVSGQFIDNSSVKIGDRTLENEATASALTATPLQCLGGTPIATEIHGDANCTSYGAPASRTAVAQADIGGGSYGYGTGLNVNQKGDQLSDGHTPFIDVRSKGVRALVPTAIPVATGITGNINAASTTLTVSTSVCASQVGATCFVNGDGIVVYGAGPSCSLATPSAPTVVPSVDNGLVGSGYTKPGAAGAINYQYFIIAADAVHGCYSAPSPATNVTTGQTLGKQSVALTSCSRSGAVVTCTTSAPHTMAAGAVVIIIGTSDDINFGVYQMVDTVPDKTHFTYTNGIDLSNGNLPFGYFNGPGGGSSTPATSATGGTVYWFNVNHLTFNSVANATHYCVYGRQAGNITWIGCSRIQPMGVADIVDRAFDDYGSPLTGDNYLRPAWISATLPSRATNRWLSSTIVSGAGTTTLTLSNAATTTVRDAITRHDNTPNLNVALASANIGGYNGPAVYFPVPALNDQMYDVNTWITVPGGLTLAVNGPLYLNATMRLQSSDEMTGEAFTGSHFFNPGFALGGESTVWINEANPGIYGSPYFYSFKHMNFQSTSANGANNLLFDMVQPFKFEDSSVVSSTSNNGGTDIPIILRGQGGSVSGGGSTSYVLYFRNAYFGAGGRSVFSYPTIDFNTTAPTLWCNGCGMTKIENLHQNGRAIAFSGANLIFSNGRIQGGANPVITELGTTGFSTSLTIEQYEQDTVSSPLVANLTGGLGTGPNNLSLRLIQAGCSGNALLSGRPFSHITIDGSYGTQNCSLSGQNHDVFMEGVNDPIAPFNGNLSSYLRSTVRSHSFMHFPGNQRLYWDFAAPTLTAIPAAGGTIAQPNTYYFFVLPVGFDGGVGTRSFAPHGCVTNAYNRICSLSWTPVAGAASYILEYATPGGGACGFTTVSGGTTSYSVTTTPTNSLGCFGGDSASGPTYLGRSEIAAPQFRMTSGTAGFSHLQTATTLTGARTSIFPDVNGFVPVTGYQTTAFDTCDRADGPIGSNWTLVTNSLNCASNQFKGNAGDNIAYWSAYPFNAVVGQGQFAETTTSVVNARSGPGVYLGNSTGNGGYICAETAATLSIYNIFNAAAGTVLTSTGITAALGDVIRLEVNPSPTTNALSCYLNGVLTLTYNDNTKATTTGSPGMDIFNTTTRLDNWSGGALHPIAQLDQEQDWVAPQHFTYPVTFGRTEPSAGTLPRGVYFDSATPITSGGANTWTGLQTAPGGVDISGATATRLSVYNRASTAVNNNIAVTNMVTSTSAEHTYLFNWTISLVTPGTSCTGKTTVELNAIFTDPNAARATKQNVTGTLTIASGGNGTVGFIASGVDSIRAKTGTAVQYSTTNFTAGANCSPAPTYKVYLTLTQLN